MTVIVEAINPAGKIVWAFWVENCLNHDQALRVAQGLVGSSWNFRAYSQETLTPTRKESA